MPIYHEKQVKSLCALHALNNLFQDSKAFRQDNLDLICQNLAPNSWLNPHKSVLGLGNYDVNVLMKALQLKNYEAIWFDKRKDPKDLNFGRIYGFILNIPSDCRLGWLALPLKRKHWVAIRSIPSPSPVSTSTSPPYYNLDSKFDSPELIGNEGKVIEYFREQLKSPEKELFIVVSSEVAQDESWKKSKVLTSEGGGATDPNTNLPVPSSSISKNLDDDIPEEIRKGSTDSGVVELLPELKDIRDINLVDLDKDELMRRQSSGVWSDLL